MIRHATQRAGLVLIAALLATPALTAQAAPVRVEEDANCRWRDSDRESYCEVREYRLDGRPELEVDAGPNGGIDVVGWDRDGIEVVARVRATSRRGDPRELAREVEIRTGRVIEATGPRTGRHDGWSVSYELRVPRSMALRLGTTNGGIELVELTGEVVARTTNGGLTLVGGAGRVRGRTTNGGLHIELLGRRWEGGGVDLQTTNGGVEIVVPDNYSAELETGTTNGGMRLDIPVMVQGRIDRVIRTRLGDGGPRIRAMTTNGGVVVRR
jgi:hypothetical protein